jgi:hypothetical protein
MTLQEPARLVEVIWLGGLDSNQDSQSQSLESYQLDDLPAGRKKGTAARPAVPAATIQPF